MIGTRPDQRELFDVGNVYSFAPDPSSFYGQLLSSASHIFQDSEFASFYSEKMGRPSVAPSLLALTTLMQHYSGVSDAEAVERTGCDLRWALILGRPAGEPLCAKSTLCMFRAHLVLHGGIRTVFERSLEEARNCGLLSKELRDGIDTKPILGRGAVEDTYNLLASGIRRLSGSLAQAQRINIVKFMRRHGLERYRAPSVKGSEMLDWSDAWARDEFLSGIVADAVKLLEMSSKFKDGPVRSGATVLEQVLLQDVDVVETDEGDRATLHKGVVPGRVPSITDPQQRHGRKSSSKRFTGAKATVVTDMASGIILETDVIAGDAPDATGALQLVESAEANAGVKIVETLGDCAYGSGATRQAFADARRELSVRVPVPTDQKGMYTKYDFEIDTSAKTVTCPNKVTVSTYHREANGGLVFSFGSACAGCALRARCTTSESGRTVRMHPQEELIRKAIQKQNDPEWRLGMRDRLVVENSLARLAGLGIGQARYIGHEKTRFQLKMSATVANLRRTWNWIVRQPMDQPILVAA